METFHQKIRHDSISCDKREMFKNMVKKFKVDLRNCIESNLLNLLSNSYCDNRVMSFKILTMLKS